jgi:hypothetical protein
MNRKRRCAVVLFRSLWLAMALAQVPMVRPERKLL